MNLMLPFCSKELPNGKKLYRKKHGYTITLAANGDTVLSISVPYTQCKVMDAEILWCPEGVTVDMKIKDTPQGTYSGTPNQLLGQHGFAVAVRESFHHDISPYDAELYLGMVIEFTLHNSTATEKTIAVNVPFHEVV